MEQSLQSSQVFSTLPICYLLVFYLYSSRQVSQRSQVPWHTLFNIMEATAREPGNDTLCLPGSGAALAKSSVLKNKAPCIR